MEPEAVIENLRSWLHGRQIHSIPERGFFSAALRPDDRQIQQDFEELQAYVTELRSLEPRNVAVEIGYDRGGTHFLWTQLFSEVISIESNYSACFHHRGLAAAVLLHLLGIRGDHFVDDLAERAFVADLREPFALA